MSMFASWPPVPRVRSSHFSCFFLSILCAHPALRRRYTRTARVQMSTCLFVDALRHCGVDVAGGPCDIWVYSSGKVLSMRRVGLGHDPTVHVVLQCGTTQGAHRRGRAASATASPCRRSDDRHSVQTPRAPTSDSETRGAVR